MGRKARTEVRDRLIETATRAVQRDGFNALSFRDLGAETGMTSATVHYYFPAKADLAEALMDRFREDFVALTEQYKDASFEEAIDSYIALFRRACDGWHGMCLGGMMSAEFTAMPEGARKGLEEFATAHRTFLVEVLRKKHPRMPADQLSARAAGIFAAMEGAQLIAKGLGGSAEAFDEIVGAYRASGLIG